MKQASFIAAICLVVLVIIAGILILDIGRPPAPDYPLMTDEPLSPATSTPFSDTAATSTAATGPVTLDTLSSGQMISSPLVLAGTADNTWFFEAQFPVKVLNATGTVLGKGIAQATTDWTAKGKVSFTALLTFSTSTTATGTVMLMKDNPSGNAAHDESMSVPVRFN